MARLKKSRKKDPSYRTEGKSRYPVERTFQISVSNASEVLVDVGKCLSAINHRLYRQGKLYTVKLEVPLNMPPGYGFTLKRLPNTWWMQKAWHLAKEARDDQLSGSNRARGRWDDFRVGWDSSYKTAYLPLLADASGQWIADEIQISKAHDAVDSVDHEFVVFGSARDAGNNLYGIIEQYDNTGNIPDQQPGGAANTDAYTQLHPDSGMVEAAGDLQALQGDNAPYDMDSFQGASDVGAVNLGFLGTIQSGTGDGNTSIITDLPLGLFKIENGTDTTIMFNVTVMAGNYKGVKAIDF